METTLCIISALLSALALLISLLIAVVSLRLGKGLVVTVAMQSPPPATALTPDIVTKKVAELQAQLDEALAKEQKQPTLDDFLGNLNSIMLGGTEHD